MNYSIYYWLIFILLIFSCKNTNDSEKGRYLTCDDTDSLILEARTDSLEFYHSLEKRNNFKNKINAVLETLPVESLNGEDAADDPAIWVNTKDPSESLVLGTNKKGGLYVYDLQGNILQYLKIGRINNVDLRDGFNFNGKEVVLVAGSNRSNNSISLFYIDKETGMLSDTIKNIKSNVDEVYGVCLYNNTDLKEFYVFVNGKGGLIEQWLIYGENGIQAEKVREFGVNSQPEGMVASDKENIVYLGVEDEGIYKIDADQNKGTQMVKIAGSDSTNKNIVYDIEGLAIFNYKNTNYLLASSQGNYSYALFQINDDEKYITSFVITDGIIDGVEETDGLEVTTFSLNKDFPQGLLVVQDGFNYDGDHLVNQNFKYVSLDNILRLLD